MWIMFLGSGVLSLGRLHPGAPHRRAPRGGGPAPTERTNVDGTASPLARVRWNRSMAGAMVAAAALGLTTGIYDICWTLLLVSRGAAGLGDRHLVDAVRRTLRGRRPAQRLARRPHGPALPGPRRHRHRHGVLCAAYPFIPCPAADGAGRHRGPRVRRRPALTPVAAHPGLGTLRGRADPGHVRHHPDRCTAVSAAAAGAAFALASWLPFVTVAAIVFVALGVVAFIWRTVPGRGPPSPVEGAVDTRDTEPRSPGRGGPMSRARADRGQRGCAVGATGGSFGHFAQASAHSRTGSSWGVGRVGPSGG